MTTTVEQPVIIPGVYDIPADAYHADPVPGGSLSSSGARRLLATCPARYRYEVDHPSNDSTDAFDLGHAAHRLVLGAGPDLVRIDAQEWRTNAIKDEVAAARAAGNVPLRPTEYDTVHAMAAALRAHPVAPLLFTAGRPEQTLLWPDGNIWRRALLDWLPDAPAGRMILPDYKTCRSAAIPDLTKAISDHGHHMQGAWYLDGLRALGLADERARFVLVCQEKTPPYLVTVVQPTDFAILRVARDDNRRAIEIYRRCVETGHWPGYSDDIELVPLPGWVEAEYERRSSHR